MALLGAKTRAEAVLIYRSKSTPSNLRHKPATLAQNPENSEASSEAETDASRKSGSSILPPLGGMRNEKSASSRIKSIVTIAFISMLVVMAIAIIAQAGLQVLATP